MNVFGPVSSRRLGRSLGIDLLPHKTCTFDCVYCECGPTTVKTLERKIFVQPDIIISELEEFLKTHPAPDAITFSGSGEPTLYGAIGKLAQAVKKMTSTNLVMITNSSLINVPEVANDLMGCDIVMPSLDAACLKTFNDINRPHPLLSLQDIIKGLSDFSHSFKGKIWLEILFCAGVNDSEAEIRDFQRILRTIRYDQLHINSVDRPPAYAGVKAPSAARLEEIARTLGGTIVCRSASTAPEVKTQMIPRADKILRILKRRPETLEGLRQALNAPTVQLVKLLDELVQSGQIRTEVQGEHVFYRMV
ncbi:MAG: radical SAM protein [Candidatus Wallbacteria bacterium]|nr:radical SAM protein [Candidatus Wallbacteria bacterium]